MLRRQRNRTWPFLMVLGCLFVLSATAPRTWQRVAREETASRLIADAAERRASRPPVVSARVPVDETELPLETTPEPIEQPIQSGGWLLVEAAEKVADQRNLVEEPFEGPELPTLSVLPDIEADEDAPTPATMTSAAPTAPQPTPVVPQIAALPDRDRLSTDSRTTPSLDEDEAEDTSAEEQPTMASDSMWRVPRRLLDQLSELAMISETAGWATDVQRQIALLGETVDHRGDVEPLLEAFEDMLHRADAMARKMDDWLLASRLRRVKYALRRRLDIWREVLIPTTNAVATFQSDPKRLSLALAEIDSLTAGHEQGRAWRDYLLVDALREASPSSADNHASQRDLARQVLIRLFETSLSHRQRSFLAAEPFQALGQELRWMAAEPVEPAMVLEMVERYEETQLPSDARRLAEQCLWLAMAPAEDRRVLSQRMANHYRNANLRVVLTEALLNRMMPKRLPEYSPVHDTILGTPVHGESLSESQVTARLIPDPNRLLVALQISGEVAALTSSTAGPATFRNTSESIYVARKPMEITMTGIRLWPAEVQEVSNVTRLYSLRTDMDGIPLLGPLVREFARDQHAEKQPEFQREVEKKTAARAKERIDEEADARLADVSQRLQQRILEPMSKLSLGPEMIDATTTDQRLTMRLRLASRRQLGAHTPRPMAPTDSLASFQIHETALNNLIERMGLDGETFTVRQLRERIAERLGRPELTEEETSHDDDVEITFAPQDAIHIACEEGRIAVTLSIARLSKYPRTWRDFQVRACYRPVVDGLSAEFVRDGVVQLPGRRVRTTAQVELRAIFSKVFSKSRSREIIPERLRQNPNMIDVVVTQLVIDDGWIGLALGPKLPVEVARRP